MSPEEFGISMLEIEMTAVKKKLRELEDRIELLESVI